MSRFNVSTQRYDPYKNFKFRVRLDGRTVAGFSKVSALRPIAETVEYRAGGEPTTLRKLLSTTKFEAITLERGVTHDPEFVDWASKVQSSGSGLRAEAPPSDFHKEITIEVFNEAGQPAFAYKVLRCWVSELQALPEVDATTDAMAIEAMRLENEGWERDLDITRR